MKLKTINKNIAKFGYPQELEYNDQTFHGHQIGVAVCVQNSYTKEIEENFLSESLGDEDTRNQLLNKLLNESDTMLITETIMQPSKEGSCLIPKTIYYMPYYVPTHSRFQPTVMFDNINNDLDVYHNITVELLFVAEDGLNRYLTISLKTGNISMLEAVYNFFDNMYSNDKELETVGIKHNESGYILDFYDTPGKRYDIEFDSIEQLRNAITSVRLIHIERISYEDKDNEET